MLRQVRLLQDKIQRFLYQNRSTLFSLSSFILIIPIWIANNEKQISYAYIYIVLCIVLSILLFSLSLFLIKKEINKEKNKDSQNSYIYEMEPAEGKLVITYMGFILIGLRLDVSFLTCIIGIVLLFIWFKLKSISYFNLFWLAWGYRLYKVKTQYGYRDLLVKNKTQDLIADEKNPIILAKQYRINNYVYIKFN